ncbi:glycosyltransferase family 4 protein [Empedobacter tilapiae]|uniref:glycosyltransferase n=1 Tax=Empedobacter tilapiae TaxID=2491114 RepID=UPI0028D8F794|nr:glycosyltransferase family 4 protein [Empedobacter tilapiae]
MKLLFVHDHPFYRDLDNVVYTGGSFPKQLWSNYLINFDKILVYGRNSKSLKSKNGVSSTTGVCFHLTEKYTSVSNLLKNKKGVERELTNLINQADVVLTRLPSVLGFIAANIAIKKNKKLWVEQVGNAKEALGTHGSLLGKIVAPIFEFQNKKIVRKANFVSYVTENKLQKDYPSTKGGTTVALSDVIIRSILNEKDLEKERFFGKIFRIGLIGGFDARYKGQDVLLKAISLLNDEIKRNIKICLVGKGDYAWILETATKLNLIDNIEFIGVLESGNQINEFLATLSLYVQPSLTEGMPRATIEAMAMGCPVIGSNVGGIPDIVSEKFVHRKENSKELAGHIQRLFLDRKLLQSESVLSLEKVQPYLKENLDKKRLAFYVKMNKDLTK